MGYSQFMVNQRELNLFSLELTGIVSPVEWDVWVEVLITLWGVCKMYYIMNGAFVAKSLPLVGNLSMALVHGS